MIKLTKAQIKERNRIEAWLKSEPFKENSRDKNPKVPEYTPLDLMERYIPLYISDGGKFYTPPEMAEYLWDNIPIVLNHQTAIKILDPCSGIGNLLYPFYRHNPDCIIDAYDLDREAVEIGQKTFPRINWHCLSPFDEIEHIEGQYDLVVMNPPINTTWGTGSALDISLSGVKKSEHLFLELAIRALRKGGIAAIIAPYNYIDKLPNGSKSWFDQNMLVMYDLGQLPGEFQFTKVNVHGWIIERISENMKQDTPIIVEQVEPVELVKKQPEFTKLQSKAPNVIFSGYLTVADIINKLSTPLVGPEPDRGLIDSIARLGVMQSIILRNGEDTDTYVILAGRRRLKAASILELSEIPAVIIDSDYLQSYSITLDENIQRSDNPICEYEAIVATQALLVEAGKSATIHDLAQTLGIPVATIRKRLRYASLAPEVRNAVRAGTLSVSKANKLLKLSKSQQTEIAQRAISGEKITAKDIDEMRASNLQTAFSSLPIDAFKTPEVNTHQHSFGQVLEGGQLYGYTCGCGFKLGHEDAVEILNQFVQ